MGLVSRFFLFSQASLIYPCQICLEMIENKMSSKLALNVTGHLLQ